VWKEELLFDAIAIIILAVQIVFLVPVLQSWTVTSDTGMRFHSFGNELF